MKFYTIYKIIHTQSGKIYIGRHITSNLDDGYMGSGKYIRHAIEKYGVQAFTKHYLYIFDNEDDMYAKEAELVTEEFCLREDTYNIAPGGFDGGFRYINQNGIRNGFEHRLDNQAKWGKLGNQSFSQWMLDSDFSLSFRQTISDSLKKRFAETGGTWIGKTHTQESKSKIGKSNSISQSGPRNSQYGLQWITNGIDSTRIKKDDLIPEGWKKGRKLRMFTANPN